MSVGNQATVVQAAGNAGARSLVEETLFAAGYPNLAQKYVDGRPLFGAGGAPVLEKVPANRAKINFLEVGLILQAIVFAGMLVYGPVAAFLSEYFSAPVRYTSVSLTYHIANGWFGGIMPIVAASIVAATGDIYAGLWYVIGAAGFSFIIGALFLRDRRRRPIEA